jgi:hypothetical protein
MSVKIYACYSATHRPLLEQHFLPSIPPGFDVVLRRTAQVCASGEYMSENWGNAVMSKNLLILEAIEQEPSPFVWSDVDVRFYDFRPEDLAEAMVGGPKGLWDVRCQQDHTVFCTGFMFIRPNQATAELFKRALDSIPLCNDDQRAFNEFALPQMMASGSQIAVSKLPHERYWNTDPAGDGQVPHGEIAIHHGNWVVGIDRKMALLDSVLAIKTARKS